MVSPGDAVVLLGVTVSVPPLPPVIVTFLKVLAELVHPPGTEKDTERSIRCVAAVENEVVSWLPVPAASPSLLHE